MAMRDLSLYCFVLCGVLSLSEQAYENPKCILQTNKGVINLNPLGLRNSTTARFQNAVPSIYTDYRYSWNPCFDVPYIGAQGGTCDSLSMAQTYIKSSDQGIMCYNLGNVESTKMIVSPNGDVNVTLAHVGEDSQIRSSSILCVCNSDLEGEFSVQGQIPGDPPQGAKYSYYYMKLESKYCCPVSPITVTPKPSERTTPSPSQNVFLHVYLHADPITILIGTPCLTLLLVASFFLCRRRQSSIVVNNNIPIEECNYSAKKMYNI